MVPLNQRLQWGNVNQKLFRQNQSCSRILHHIQPYSDIFRHTHAYSNIFSHIQIYSGIIRHIKELFRHIQSPVQPWHIKNSNPGILRTRSIFRTMVYSELWNIQNRYTFRIGGIFRTLPSIFNGAFYKSSQLL